MNIFVTRKSITMKTTQVLILFLIATFGCTLNASTDEWKLIPNDNGIKLFAKQHNKGSLVSLKAEMILPFSIEQVACVLADTSKKKQWAPSLIKNSIIKETSNYQRIEYLLVDFPWPLKDRDFLLLVNVNVSDDARNITITTRSIIDDKLAPETRFVRGFIHECSMILTDEDGQTKLSFITCTDPKGNLPKWAVNLFTRTLAPATMFRFRNQVERTQYDEQEIRRINDLLHGYCHHKSRQINDETLYASK